MASSRLSSRLEKQSGQSATASSGHTAAGTTVGGHGSSLREQVRDGRDSVRDQISVDLSLIRKQFGGVSCGKSLPRCFFCAAFTVFRLLGAFATPPEVGACNRGVLEFLHNLTDFGKIGRVDVYR